MRRRKGNAHTENKWSRNGEKKMMAFHQMFQGLLHLLSKRHFIFFSFSGPYILHCNHNKCKIRVLWKSLWINICLNHTCAVKVYNSDYEIDILSHPKWRDHAFHGVRWGKVYGWRESWPHSFNIQPLFIEFPSRRQILGWTLKAEKVPRKELRRSACQMDEDISVSMASILMRIERQEKPDHRVVSWTLVKIWIPCQVQWKSTEGF